MKRFGTVVLVVAVAGSALLLVLSLWPGVFPNLAFLAVFAFALSFPLAVIGILIFIVLAVSLSRRPRGRQTRLIKSPRDSFASGVVRLILAGVVLLPSLAAVVTGVPRRLVFALCRPSFERLVGSAPVSEYDGETLDRRVGIWHVDRYAADPRGGVYFRTATGPDDIGIDEMSYGFAFKPNPEGSPFGNAHYCRARLTGDWFYFQASDDW